MQDTTVSGPAFARAIRVANTRRKFFGRAVRHADEDELLARVLITSWSLNTGRTLRAGVTPQSLTEDELITFWADDQIATPWMTRPWLTASQRDWLRVRAYLQEHRHDLVLDAAGRLPGRLQDRRDPAAGRPRLAARRPGPAAGHQPGVRDAVAR